MRQNTGIAAGLLALVAFFGVSTFKSKGPESPATVEADKPPVRSKKAKTEKGKNSTLGEPCSEIAKRLRRFIKTDDAPEKWKLPESCYLETLLPSDSKDVMAKSDVHFAVTLVPNPVATHLPLMFDRILESIQQAVQDENYSYDTSWFPWDAAEGAYDRLDDQLTAEAIRDAKHEQPGVIVFRNALRERERKESFEPPYSGGLIIFVVAEQPTEGVSDDQFDHAIEWIDKLGGLSNGTLQILGPTFSGSLPSLALAIDRCKKKGKRVSELSIYSGTVSSAVGYHWFTDWAKSTGINSDFRTLIESDSLMTDRLCEYLKQDGYEDPQIAIVSEDETAFGTVPNSRTCQEAVNLFYPRDIATLRSAYQQQSVWKSNGEQPASARSRTLQRDLSEHASNEHDTMRSYGGQLTPLAQESILLDIANRLKEKRIEFVVLRSTNSLDQIFLSQFLRQSYPEGRVVIDGADLLSAGGVEGRLLNGVMLLSTYPLLTEEQDWTTALVHEPSGSYRTFAEDASEGVYIAARELFRNVNYPSQVPIRDYSAPAWAVRQSNDQGENQRPSTWLSVIGRRKFWALAALNSNTLKNRSLTSNLRELAIDRGFARKRCGDSSPLRLPATTWMVVALCVAWSAVHYCFCWKGSILGSPRSRAYFAPMPRWEHPALIALGSAIVASMGVILATGSGLFSWTDHPYQNDRTGVLLLLALAAILVLAVGACWKNYRLPTVRSSDSAQPTSLSVLSLLAASAVVLLALIIFIQIGLVQGLTPANWIPAYWRSVNLTSGVSAMLPELLLLVGAYLWFWCNLRGLAHFGEDRPVLPSVKDLPNLNEKPLMPMFSDEGAGRPIEKEAYALGTWENALWFLAFFILTYLACGLALGGFSLRTLGELRFGTMILICVCLFIARILADSFQLWRAWRKLHMLLVFLDRLPLRRTLRALKGLAWGSIWKLSGNVLEERYRVISLQFESFRHLINTSADWPDAMPTYSTTNRELKTAQDRNIEFVRWFVDLDNQEVVSNQQVVSDVTKLRNVQLSLASLSGMVMSQVLIPAWHAEKASLLFEQSDRGGKESKGPERAPSYEQIPQHVRAAEEFFVLPYLAFIQNMLGRIRTIVLGSVGLFVFATLAVSSYPFEPLSGLGGVFLAVFVIAGFLMIVVYSQMSRDATLSHITNTKPGELGLEFWFQLVGFGIGPLIGLLTTLFPSIPDSVFSWIEPSTHGLK